MGQVFSRDCEQMRGYVSASLDGELSELEATRLQAHLASCAGCRTYATTAREATRLMRSTPLEELDFPIALPSRRLAVARRLQVAAAAAAVAATLGLSVVAGSTGVSSPQSPRDGKAVKSANLRFPEQELRLLHRAQETRQNLVVHSRLAL